MAAIGSEGARPRQADDAARAVRQAAHRDHAREQATKGFSEGQSGLAARQRDDENANWTRTYALNLDDAKVKPSVASIFDGRTLQRPWAR